MDTIAVSDPKSSAVWPTPTYAEIVLALKAGARAAKVQPDEPLDSFPLTSQLLNCIQALLSRSMARLPWLLADESPELGECVARISYLARSVIELAGNLARSEERLAPVKADTGHGPSLEVITGLEPFSPPARDGEG